MGVRRRYGPVAGSCEHGDEPHWLLKRNLITRVKIDCTEAIRVSVRLPCTCLAGSEFCYGHIPLAVLTFWMMALVFCVVWITARFMKIAYTINITELCPSFSILKRTQPRHCYSIMSCYRCNFVIVYCNCDCCISILMSDIDTRQWFYVVKLIFGLTVIVFNCILVYGIYVIGT
jgi:hypothetical protein